VEGRRYSSVVGAAGIPIYPGVGVCAFPHVLEMDKSKKIAAPPRIISGTALTPRGLWVHIAILLRKKLIQKLKWPNNSVLSHSQHSPFTAAYSVTTYAVCTYAIYVTVGRHDWNTLTTLPTNLKHAVNINLTKQSEKFHTVLRWIKLHYSPSQQNND